MKLLMIAKSNMKKKKSNIILIFILVTIATIFLYTGINVVTSVSKYLDNVKEKQNGADVILMADTGFDKEINEVLENINGYKESESEEALILSGYSIENITTNSDKDSYTLLMMTYEKERTISNIDYIKLDDKLSDDSIILPEYFKTARNYNIGDKVKITNGANDYIFDIAGFNQDVMFAIPSNAVMFKCYVSDNIMEEFGKDDQKACFQAFYNVNLDNSASSDDYENELTKTITKEISDVNFSTSFAMNYETMKMSTSVFIDIIMAILALFAAIIVIISLIVIRFSINTSIESNMHNIGILEAVGYTGKLLRRSTLLEYSVVSIIGSAIGIVLSGISSKFVAGIVSEAIGLVWKPEFSVSIAAISIVLINTILLIITWCATGKYNSITPLIALRNGISTHNFKKNHISLDKGIFDLNTSLGLKEIMQNKKQSISMIVIVALLSFSSIFAMNVYYNFAYSQDGLINIIGMEKPNISIVSNDNNVDLDEIYKELEKREDIENVLYYSEINCNLINGDRNMSLSTYATNEIDNLKYFTLVKGRAPKHDNEIVVTNVVLDRLNARVGDTIYVEGLGQRKPFVIVGVNQQVVKMGMGATITEEGINTLNQAYVPNTIYLYLNDTENLSNTIKDLENQYKDINISINDFDEIYNGVLSSFESGIKVLTIVCSVVTIVVIVLILFMLIRMKLLKNRKIYGIYKAVGYTTNQLTWQITMNFTPIIIIGVIIGLILGVFLINPLFSLSLSISGIEHCSIVLSPILYLGTFILITIASFVISMIFSRRVKKIEPCKMIVE